MDSSLGKVQISPKSSCLIETTMHAMSGNIVFVGQLYYKQTGVNEEKQSIPYMSLTLELHSLLMQTTLNCMLLHIYCNYLHCKSITTLTVRKRKPDCSRE